MKESPFDLTLNYYNKQIINQNLTITTQLQRNLQVPINCEDNQYSSCLVDLSLQIQSDTISIDYWCQSPAFSNENSNQFKTCMLSSVNSTQQPSITMIINARNAGNARLVAKANFTYSSGYYIEKQSEVTILIDVRIKT
jgi:hypothetical protein